jgi:hypothetical protein
MRVLNDLNGKLIRSPVLTVVKSRKRVTAQQVKYSKCSAALKLFVYSARVSSETSAEIKVDVERRFSVFLM